MADDTDNIDNIDINEIYNKYPWALNSTVERLGHVAGDDVKSTMKALKEKGKLNSELEKITKQFIDSTEEIKYGQKAFIDSTYAVKSFMGDTNALRGTVKLVEDFSGIIIKLAPNLMTFPGASTPVVQKLGKVVGGTGKALTAAAGVLYVYSDLITEHVKSTRVMINYGMAVGDLNIYSDMRDSFGELGMSLNEGLNAYKSFMPAFANLDGPMTSNVLALNQFAHALSQNYDFGNTSSYVANKLNVEVDLLRKYLKIESINHLSQKELLQRYGESATRHLVLAELLGVNVSNWENDREEANDDIEFQHSIIKRSGYLAEQFGEESATNILSFNEQTYSLFKNVFGSNFAADTREHLNKAIFGIEHGATIESTFTEDMNTKLLMLGDDVRDEYIAILEAGRSGKLHGPELDSRLQKFVKMIAYSDPIGFVDVISPNVEDARRIKALAKTAPSSYLNATDTTFSTLSSKVLTATELADDSVDALDDMKIAMRKIYNTLTPGFGTTGASLKLFSTALKMLTSAFGSNLDTQEVITDTSDWRFGRKSSIDEIASSSSNTSKSSPQKIISSAKEQSEEASHTIHDHIDNNQAWNLGKINTNYGFHEEYVVDDGGTFTVIGDSLPFAPEVKGVLPPSLLPSNPNFKGSLRDVYGDTGLWIGTTVEHELELSQQSLDKSNKMREITETKTIQDQLIEKPFNRFGRKSSGDGH